MRVLGFGGSTGPHSSTLAALRVVLSAAAAEGAETELIDVGSLDLPMYRWGALPSADAQRMVDAFSAADALVWASPLYHGSVSGLFKNAIDWVEVLADRQPPYLSNKPVGLIAVSAGGMALAAIHAMEPIVRALRGWVVPLVVPIDRSREVFGPEGQVLDARVEARLRLLSSELSRAAAAFARPGP